MHKTLLTALAAAILFSVAMPATRAIAMAVAMPSTGAISPLVHEAAIICGGNGCNPVHTKSEKRRQYKPLGYTKPLRQSVIVSLRGTA